MKPASAFHSTATAGFRRNHFIGILFGSKNGNKKYTIFNSSYLILIYL